MKMIMTLAAAFAIAGLAAPSMAPAWVQAAASVRQQAKDLIASDRAFAAASSARDSATAIASQFHDEVIMPLPDGSFARGRGQAEAALRSNPFNLASKAQWTPIRAGISADGRHGFTFGYMTMTGEDGSRRLLKYLAYWVKTGDGWRVAAYRRSPRPEGEVSLAVMTPSLPAGSWPDEADPGRIEAHRRSLIEAEQAFSDEAQRIGLGPAFLRNGREDAVNVGGGPAFTVGAAEIARFVGGDSPPSPVSWSAQEALVATSGDLGVTFGLIRPNGPPPEGRPAAIPFFTIWRRDTPAGRWLYIAE